MPKYIPFTDTQKEQAASVDLEKFLRRRGEKLIASGRDKRLVSNHSITIRGCEWFDHATEQGGKAITSRTAPKGNAHRGWGCLSRPSMSGRSAF